MIGLVLLILVPLIFVLIAAYFVFKTAKEYGRHAVGWALTTVVVGFGLQWVLPTVIAIILSLILSVTGLFDLETRASIIAYTSFFGGLGLSFGAILLIIRHVSIMPDEKPYLKPPSPPKFD